MVRRATLQNAMTKGVLDPRLADRIDLAHYYSGLRVATNCQVRPQGGAHRRPGTDTGPSGPVRIRRRLDPLPLTAGMMTAHNGGSTANLAAQNPALVFVSNAVNASPFVLVEVDLGAAVAVALVDVIGFSCAASRADNALAVEYYDGSQWLTFGAAPAGESLRRHIRSNEHTVKSPVRVATTKNITREGLDPIDGVTPVAGDRILVKNQTAAHQNGIFLAGLGVWARSGDGDTGGELENFVVTVSDGSQAGTWWRQPSKKVTVGTTPLFFERVPGPARTRRYGTPPDSPTTARYLRVVVYGGVGIGAVTLTHLRVWREKRAVSPAKLLRFARDDRARLVGVLTAHNLDFFGDQRWIASVPVAVAPEQIDRVTVAQSLDSMFVYDADLETPLIQRQGANVEWESSPAYFFNVPEVTGRTAFAGKQDAVQNLIFEALAVGDEIRLELGSLFTAPITFASAGALPASVVSALEGLHVVGAGNVAATLVGTTPLTVRVHFHTAAGRRFWPALSGIVLGVAATATVRSETVQAGFDADGPLFGATTGWPRAGVLYQGRHYVGGMHAAPNTVAASRVGNGFDFTDTADPFTADLAFADTFQSERSETIREMFVGKHLLAFSDAGVWFTDTRAPLATEPRNWRLGSRPGIEPGVPIAWTEQAAHYIQKGGATLRQLLIAESVEADYAADPANILNPDLVAGVTDMAVVQPLTPDEGASILMRRSDGTMTCLSLLRSQDLLAVTPWRTAAGDAFTAVVADDLERLWVLARRTTEAHGADLYLERCANRLGLDGTIHVTLPAPASVVTGLDMHEGREVWAWVDGDLHGPYTVTGGQIALEVPGTAVSVGLATDWELEPMPLREKLQNGYPWRPPARLYEAEVVLRDTGHLEVSVNGGAWQPVPLLFAGAVPRDAGPFAAGGDPGLPLLERLKTGGVTLANLQGWSKHPRIAFRQTRPAPVEVTAIRCELAHHG